jgi:hypothetical protein
VRRHDRSSAFALVILVALVASLATIVGPSPAAATPIGWSWSGDYATEELGDPWDFRNDEDWDIQARWESRNISNAVVSGGTLKFNAAPQGYVLIGSARYGSDALQWGRSTWLRPLETARYPTVTFRLFSSLPDGQPAGFNWYTCGFTIPSCDHNRPFLVNNGWNTYTFNMSGYPGWSGNVYSFRLTPAGVSAGGSFELDYLRVLRPGGQLGESQEPVPVVLDPSRADGVDWAKQSRGKGWTFDGPGDVVDTPNVTNVSYANGQLHGCSTNNDPAVILHMPVPADGNSYDRFFARVRYDGGFSLDDVAGGGMNARILFRTAGSGVYQVTQDIVVYPGWNDIELELGSLIPQSILEEGTTGTGWSGQSIAEIRFDLHEDRGVRCFSIDEMRLTTVAIAAPSFAIRFRDDANGVGAPIAGTTAEVFLDKNRGTFGGTRIASGLAVGSGVNTFNWPGGGVDAGQYWLWVRYTAPNGRQSSAYAAAPIVYFGPRVLPVAAKSVTTVGTGQSGSAALVNLTMTGASAPGYLTAGNCSTVQNESRNRSNGNHVAGQDMANLGVVPIDGNGQFCLYNDQALNMLADLQGVFRSGGALRFSQFSSPRFDTRFGTKPPGGRKVRITTGAPAGTQAVLVNLTMTEAAAPGYLTADRCSTLEEREQQRSNANYVAGQNIANLSVVPVDTDGSFCVYTSTSVHVASDLQGVFSPGGALSFTPVSTARFDTRSSGRPAANTIRKVTTGLAPGTELALVNVTMTQSDGGGYITADRCSALSPGLQQKSNANFAGGRDIANLAVVPLDADGNFCIYTERPVHLIVDVQGAFTSGGSQQLTLVGPERRLDTRNR